MTTTNSDQPATSGRRVKSSAAFRTISEVASELDLPPHVLRFWESKFNQLRPLKRGGGRRYYRPEDVDLIRWIRDLLYTEGYTIKGVQKLLREGRGKIAFRVETTTGAALPEMRGDEGTWQRQTELRAVIQELKYLRNLLDEV